MNKKIISPFGIIFLLLLLILGCGKSEKTETPKETEPIIQMASLQEKLVAKKAESANYFSDSIMTILINAQNEIANSGVLVAGHIRLG